MGLARRFEPLLLLPRKLVLRIRLGLRSCLLGSRLRRRRLGLPSFLFGGGRVSPPTGGPGLRPSPPSLLALQRLPRRWQSGQGGRGGGPAPFPPPRSPRRCP